jgi:addiction module HigA family antidote
MRMKNPPHPGLSVRYDCLDPLGLSVAEGAKVLGVTRQAMNNLVSGKAGISAEMAIRLEKAFGGGAETWLRMQAAYDLARAEKHAAKIKVRRVKTHWHRPKQDRSRNRTAVCRDETRQLRKLCARKTCS